MPDDDIPARVSALEAEVAQMRTRIRSSAADGTAARFLAAEADKDLGTVRDELRAHWRALNALREDHVEFTQEMSAFRGVVLRRFSVVEPGIHTIIGLLERPAE